MNGTNFNREVGDKVKGFRLQKLRAVQLALNEIITCGDLYLYFAVEHLGDAFIYSDDFEHASKTSEEDKNYDSSTGFTFNNHNIINSLVIFLLTWREKRFDSHFKFSFYTTARIGIERESTVLVKDRIPKDGLLRNISERKYDIDHTLSIAKELILKEMRGKGYQIEAEFYEKIDEKVWREFFDNIIWQFEQKDEKELFDEVIQLIKKVPYYEPIHHEGFEDFILTHLLDDIDEKQSRSEYHEKIMTLAEIKIVFLEAKHPQTRNAVDPTHDYFKKIQIINQRNLNEKIQSVCKKYPREKSSLLSRMIVSSEIEQNSLKGNRALLSQMCRVYLSCEEYISNNPLLDASAKEVDEFLTTLANESLIRIEELSKSFDYPLVNQVSIQNMIYDLFNKCYLDFKSSNDSEQVIDE